MKTKSIVAFLSVAVVICLVFTAGFLTGCGNDDKIPEATVTGISLDTSGVKTIFEYGEAFTYAGLKVTAKMSDETEKEAALTDCTVSTPMMTVSGRRLVNVTYKGFTESYYVTVGEKPKGVIDETPLAQITGPGTYRIEAENINFAATDCIGNDGGTDFIESPTSPASQITSGGRSAGRLGVVGNYFGFAFTSDKEYSDVTMIMCMASVNFSSAIIIDEALEVKLNDELIVTEYELVRDRSAYSYWDWKNITVSGNTVKAGLNTLAFLTLDQEIPNMDYFEFSLKEPNPDPYPDPDDYQIRITESGTYSIEAENADLSEASLRDDIIKAYGPDSWTESAEGAAAAITSGGVCLRGLAIGSKIIVNILSEIESSVDITFRLSKGDSPKVDDYLAFSFNDAIFTMGDSVKFPGYSVTYTYWNWGEFTAKGFTLEEGENTLVLECLDKDFNFDNFIFKVPGTA